MKYMLHVAAISFSFFAACTIAKTEPHQAFLKAEKLALAGKKSRLQSELKRLEHPLKPYVQQAFYRNHPSLKDQKSIGEFLNIYEGTALDWRLRKSWLSYLAKRNKPALFIRDFKPTSDATLNCQHLRFQLSLGAPEQAILKQVEPLWLVGKSQPKACDPLFNRWIKKGFLSNELVWQRVGLAATKGQLSLLPYLKKQLPKNERYLVELYKKVRRDPSASAGLYRYKKRSEKEAEIAVYGVKRLIWRDKELALRAWDKLTKMFDFSADQKHQVARSFALSLATSQHKQAAFWLNKVPKNRHDKTLRQWQLANLLAEQNWGGVIAYLTGMERLTSGEKYWNAYAHQQLGEQQIAEHHWKNLASERHYYGFLAAARLDLPVSLSREESVKDLKITAEIEGAEAFKRAKAFYELGRLTSARREWVFLTKGLTVDEKVAAAQLASEMGWHDRTIVTLAQAKKFDLVDLRFPQAYSELFEKYSQIHKVDLAWSYAISRRESSFSADAHSSAGAIGVMQLLPSTAKYINRKRVSKRKMRQPQTNIRLGTKYLKYLKKKTDMNEILATASYNAGLHRVVKWIPETPQDVDLWIESIPFSETRDYVKNVFAYRQVYQSLLNPKQAAEENLFKPLLELKIGK